jgi:hypothetical protein
MIHRIDRVNPDVDDRVIKPNEAREAINLRFGASTDDENLSGGTLFLGNEEVSFVFPGGTNTCVGIYADYENRFVFFAMHNDQKNHGIYRINSLNNDVKAVVSGDWLNFVLTYADGSPYNVSMTSIDGKLYWTDNVNEPRMVNVEKGIRTQVSIANQVPGTDVYPSPVKEWHYTQIKRPPALPLYFLPNSFTLEEASIEYQNLFPNPIPVQFTYYYVYDNKEESRMGPWSAVTWWSKNLTITIPSAEYNDYLSGVNIVTAIVFVFRRGNDGIAYSFKRVLNNASFTGNVSISDISLLSKNPVSSDITNADFDSVPLLSVSNEIAQKIGRAHV